MATGVMAALGPRTPSSPPTASTGTPWPAGFRPTSIMAEMFGKETGCSRGRGGSMHLFDRRPDFVGGNAIVGGGLPLAIGLALADKLRGDSGSRSASSARAPLAEGEFHESLNLAALWQLPVLFCCENNRYAMGTALAKEHAATDLALRAASYGVRPLAVDGMDVEAVEAVTKEAVRAVRAGRARTSSRCAPTASGPTRCTTPTATGDKAEVEEWKEHDPIRTLEKRMRRARSSTTRTWPTIEAEIADTIARAVAFAEEAPLEPVDQLTRFVTLSEEAPV